jgi:hypothetical protein
MTGRSTASEDRIALALLALLVVAAFANVVFGGKTLIPSENANPLDPRPSVRNSGPDFVPPEEWLGRNVLLFSNYRDTAAGTMQMEPAHELLRRSILRGEFPFWDPGSGGGTASHAALTGAYLFPPSLVVILLGNGSLIRNFYILLLIFASGVFTYFLLRRLALRWEAALAGAIAFAFSGAVIQTTPSNIGQPVVFFSLALLVTMRVLERPGARRAAEMALLFALIASASFPPVLLQVFGLCVLYAIIALIRAPRETRVKALLWFAGGAALSLAIAAVVYLPAILLMGETPHVREYYSTAAADILDPRHVLQLLGPTVMGGPAIYFQPAVMGTTGLHLFYTGVVALFLAGIGFLTGGRGRPPLHLTVSIAAILSLLKLFGVQPMQWLLTHAPMLRSIHYGGYFGITVAYAVAILAAFGLDALLDGRARRWHIVTSGGLLVMVLGVLRFFAYRRLVHVHPEGWRWIADYRLIVLFMLLAIALAYFARRAPEARTTRWLIVAVLAIEGITNACYPRARRWNVWSHPPRYIEVMDALHTGGRVLPMPIFPANTPSIFGQRTLDSLYAFNSPRIYDFYRRYFNSGASVLLRETVRIPNERALDAANVEYLAIGGMNPTAIGDARRRSYEILYSDSLMQLLRRPTAPRYSFTTDYRVVPPEQALEAIATLPRNTVLLEQPPSFPVERRALSPPVRVLKFAMNEETLEVDAPTPGLVVCSESQMNGWTATVDGRAARILRANYAFRAVEVPRGKHVIHLRYRAPGFAGGLAISAAALLLAAAGLTRRVDAPAPE